MTKTDMRNFIRWLPRGTRGVRRLRRSWHMEFSRKFNSGMLIRQLMLSNRKLEMTRDGGDDWQRKGADFKLAATSDEMFRDGFLAVC